MTEAAAPSAAHEERAPWSTPRLIGFRFFACYWALYLLPMATSFLPFFNDTGDTFFRLWLPLVQWVGEHVLHLSYKITVLPAGSGDTTFDYVILLCYAAIAAGATVVWSIVDRRRREYEWLEGGLRVVLRYSLGVIMLSYGGIKLIPTQFGRITADRLIQPYGESSPMGLLWTFMGASVAYNIFTGLGELVGGLLLTLRRTTLLGALVCMGVLSNVVMLNFSYDVPVKLYSLHLFLMAVYLAAPDARRLLNVLVFNRPAEPAEIRPRFQRKWLRWGSQALGVALILWTSWLSFNQSYQQRKTFVGPASNSPLQGLWNVEELVMDGQVRPPLVTDETRWRRMVFSNRSRMGIQLMNDTRVRYNIEVDPKKKTIAFEKREDPSWKTTLNYRRPQRDLLLVEGPWEGKQLRVRLRLTKPPEFLLVTRGFHWINERPFNR